MRVLTCLMLLAALASGCQPAAPPPLSTEVTLAAAAALPQEPDDPAWNAAPEFVAKLLLQDLVEPRLLEASTAEVRVRGLSDGRAAAFRLTWTDPSLNDMPGPAMFSDACAVQLPAKIEPTVPAPQMGEPGRAVELVLWQASWQATVDGRGDTIRDLYPRASIDHYPFDARPLASAPAEQRAMAARYAPARALGNMLAGPRTTPVMDLVAEGPGTLSPARPATASSGRGRRTTDGWSVVVQRPLPAGLSPQNRTHVALAVWQGAQQEAGARKMRTGWIPLVMKEQR